MTASNSLMHSQQQCGVQVLPFVVLLFNQGYITLSASSFH